MPLNLGESALSVIKLGESTLTAIYAGDTRVYPNQVQISIDGGQVQTGEPGDPISTPLTYTVNPSNQSTKNWTTAQIAAATLTGLPSGFTASFSATGGFGNQVGTWSITTSNGQFPATDTNILTSNLTSTIAETDYGSVSLTVNRSGSMGSGAATLTFTNYVGQTAANSLTGVEFTPIGQYVNTTYQTGTSGLTYNSGVAMSGSWVNGTSVTYKQFSFTCTIPSTGTSNSNVSLYGAGVGQSPGTYQQPSVGVNSPPWSSPPSDLPAYVACWYNGSGVRDSGLQAGVGWRNISGTSQTKFFALSVQGGNGSSSLPPQGWQYYSVSKSSVGLASNASGTYEVFVATNWGHTRGAGIPVVAANANSSWPNPSSGSFV